MKHMTLCLLLALLTAPLFAGEKEDANTKALLDGLTSVKESALGKHEFRFAMMGVEIGKFTLEITKGENDGKPCYVATATGALTLGGVKRDIKNSARIAPNLVLISQEMSEADDGKEIVSGSWVAEKGVYKVHMVNKDAMVEAERDRNLEVKPEFNLLAGMTDMLVTFLLPAEARTYAFREWDDDDNKVYPATIEVSVDKDTVRIVQTSTDANKDNEGKVTTRAKIVTTVIKAGKVVSAEFSNGTALLTEAPAKRTPITDEAMAKQDKECHAVALFFKASVEHSEEKMNKAVDIDAFAETAMDKSPNFKGMSKEDRDATKPLVSGQILKNLMGADKKQTDREKKLNAAAIALFLAEENFVVAKGEGEQKIVTLTEQGQAVFSKLEFIVAKNKDGKWQIVWIENKSPQPPEEEPEGKDEGKGGDK